MMDRRAGKPRGQLQSRVDSMGGGGRGLVGKGGGESGRGGGVGGKRGGGGRGSRARVVTKEDNGQFARGEQQLRRQPNKQ